MEWREGGREGGRERWKDGDRESRNGKEMEREGVRKGRIEVERIKGEISLPYLKSLW